MASTSSFLADKSSANRSPLLSDINVTPFVDVMLVLLVIFMITAPMMATGIKVDLPKARTSQLAADVEPLQISVDAQGHIYVEDAPVAPEDFAPTLQQIARAVGDPTQMRVFVGADRSLDYGVVMGVASQIATAGFTKVALLSDSRKRTREQVVP